MRFETFRQLSMSLRENARLEKQTTISSYSKNSWNIIKIMQKGTENKKLDIFGIARDGHFSKLFFVYVKTHTAILNQKWFKSKQICVLINFFTNGVIEKTPYIHENTWDLFLDKKDWNDLNMRWRKNI